MLPQEKLHVYGKPVAFVAAISALSASWNRKHAVVDQFDRASESLVVNLADGTRLRSIPRMIYRIAFTAKLTMVSPALS
jgi:hypothetical protein